MFEIKGAHCAQRAHFRRRAHVFFNELLWLYTRGVHGQAAGCTFYEPVRSDGAQNKTLISNTARASEHYICCAHF